jgi:DeoR family transcriptional regulator of aga operon
MLNRKMVRAAQQVIAVTDRSKFGRVCLHRIMNVGDIDDLVTDAGEVEGMQAAAERLGFRLHLA